MKKILIIYLINTLPVLVFAQSKIYNANELNIGLYKTYEEMMSNSPSITKEFVVTETGTLGTMNGKNPYDFKITDGTRVGKVYGFCDGKNVYVKGLTPRGFVKVDYLGRYPFFNFVTHGVGLAVALMPDYLTIIYDNGKLKNASVNFVSKLLREKNPTLADEYDKLPDRRAKREEYLIKLNELLKDQ